MKVHYACSLRYHQNFYLDTGLGYRPLHGHSDDALLPIVLGALS